MHSSDSLTFRVYLHQAEPIPPKTKGIKLRFYSDVYSRHLHRFFFSEIRQPKGQTVEKRIYVRKLARRESLSLAIFVLTPKTIIVFGVTETLVCKIIFVLSFVNYAFAQSYFRYFPKTVEAKQKSKTS